MTGDASEPRQRKRRAGTGKGVWWVGVGVGWRRDGRLLLVVVLAVKFPFSEVAAGGEGLLTHGALQTLFVPRRVVDPHQEAVGDGPLASLAHRRMVTVAPCGARPGETQGWGSVIREKLPYTRFRSFMRF